MKLITFTTLALSASSIVATSNSQFNYLKELDFSSLISSVNIRQYISSEQIYDKVQELSHISKEDFVRELNSQIDQIQTYIGYLDNFVEHAKNLTPEQEDKIKELWAEIEPKYTENPLPTSLEELKKTVTPDLLKLYGIVCNSYSVYLLSYFSNLF